MAASEGSVDGVLRLIDTFELDDRPEVVALTGGEPLLRPRLVSDLTERAHRVGTRVHLLTGMFFARSSITPAPIGRALAQVDHVSASLDVFHEREVPRTAVFRVFAELLKQGKHVSLQIVGTDDSDPYLEGLVNDVRTVFDDRVPVLVSGLRAEGRAKAWLPADDNKRTGIHAEASPCTMAAWPVVCADGRVTACCNQAVVDGTGPAHLTLGHAVADSWSTLRAKCQGTPTLQAIRTLGPTYLAAVLGTPSCDGYCANCHKLAEQPDLREKVTSAVRPFALRVMDDYVAQAQRGAGPVHFAERFGMARYADLVALGGQGESSCHAS
jgi:pyruvate-formate lyase-activating enzyme